LFKPTLKNQNMKSKVIVTADAAGNVVVPSSNNSEWGHIRVTQKRVVIDERGFARPKTASALIAGLVKDLKDFGWKAGQELDGTIYYKEQLEPFNKKEPKRDMKVAGKTGIPCCIDGQVIYRKGFYTTNPNQDDVFIIDEYGCIVSHDNGDAIREAYRNLSVTEPTLSEDDFNQM
jgi:hypothetical protein